MEQPTKTTSNNNFVKWLIFGILIILCISTGAIVMCKHSGGEIETANWTCNQLRVVGLCEAQQGVALITPEQAVKLNITLDGVFVK